MKLKYSIAHTFVYVIFILTFLKFCFYIKSEPAQQQYTSQLKSTKVFCSSATLDKCLDHWFQMSEDPGKAFPITYDDLENTCVAMEKMDQCANNFIKVCAEKQFHMMFHEMLQGVKGVFSVICVPGKDQNEFLKYSECYQLVTVKECEIISKKFRENAMMHNLNSNTTDQKNFCCDYKLMIDCQEEGIKKLCPPGANTLFQNFMPKMAKTVLNDHCAHYIINQKCHTLANRHHILTFSKHSQNVDKQNSSKLANQSTDLLLKRSQLKTNLKNSCTSLLNLQKMFILFIFIVYMLF